MSKQIPLSQGRFALIDDEDYERVSKFNWSYHKEGYAFRSFSLTTKKRGYVYLHRFILDEPDGLVDHKNWDGLDCRRENLRVTDKSGNAHNSKLSSCNTSGVKGVNRKRAGWEARIKVEGVVHRLGNFKSFPAAVAARRAAEKRLIGHHIFYREE